MSVKAVSLPLSRARFLHYVERAIVYGLVIAGALVTALPFIWMILGSFKSHADFGHIPLLWLPSKWLPSNYLEVFNLMPFARMYLNSIIVAVCVTCGVLLTSSMGAYAFARIKFWGRNVVFLLYLATIMIPGWVTLIPVFVIIKDLKWLNTYQGLIIPALTSAFGTFLLRQFFLSVPQDYEDAAYMDGANYFQIYSQLILPLAKPALLTVGLISFMGSWNSLLWPLIIMSKPEMQTIPLGLARLALTAGWVRIEWGPLMAANLLAILPIATIYAFLQNYFIRGIALSGLK
jgi:multiple sugar transport system permease protein